MKHSMTKTIELDLDELSDDEWDIIAENIGLEFNALIWSDGRTIHITMDTFVHEDKEVNTIELPEMLVNSIRLINGMYEDNPTERDNVKLRLKKTLDECMKIWNEWDRGEREDAY